MSRANDILRAGRVAALGGLLALAGCTMPQGRPAPPRPEPGEYDPLVGGIPIPPSNTPATGKGLLAEDEPKPGTLPALPDAKAPTSPAALTRGGLSAADKRPPAAAATLGGPQPKVDIPAPGGLVQTAATERPLADQATYEQLQDLLKARGVVWQQLKNDNARPELWLFSCAIPDRNNRDMRSVFEGEGPSPLAAIRAALRKFDP